MFSFRGDGHKLYLELRRNKDSQSIQGIKETAEIKSFYESLDSYALQLTRYRMIKEQNGMGLIPILVTAVPWLLFLFSSKIQNVLFKDGSILWAIFSLLYLVVLTVSAIGHFKEKAWTAFHIHIIQDILNEREEH